MTIYKLTNSNGYTESEDLQSIQLLRVIFGGTIEAISRTFAFTNDPLSTIYETSDVRDYDMTAAKDAQFQPLENSELIDPQPEGLND